MTLFAASYNLCTLLFTSVDCWVSARWREDQREATCYLTIQSAVQWVCFLNAFVRCLLVCFTWGSSVWFYIDLHANRSIFALIWLRRKFCRSHCNRQWAQSMQVHKLQLIVMIWLDVWVCLFVFQVQIGFAYDFFHSFFQANRSVFIQSPLDIYIFAGAV